MGRVEKTVNETKESQVAMLVHEVIHECILMHTKKNTNLRLSEVCISKCSVTQFIIRFEISVNTNISKI